MNDLSLQAVYKNTKPFLNLSYKELKQKKSFLMLVLFPWACISLYLVCLKTPVYESTAKILIHHYTPYSPRINGLKSVFSKNQQNSITPESAPIFLLQRYIHSQTLLDELDKSINIKQQLQSHQIDWISRLKNNPNQKEFLEYYLNKVTLSLDATSGELSITTKAFSPQKAQELLTLILSKATDFLKKTNADSSIEQIQLLENNLEKARQKLISAEMALRSTIKTNKEYVITNSTIERQKLDLKFAKLEYESAQQAYVLWSLSIKKNTPVQTSSPSVPDYYASPNIPHDLINLFVVFSAFFLLGKMILLLVREHTD